MRNVIKNFCEDEQTSNGLFLIDMPTGAGKSVCFQVPALIFDGVTLVVSPLVSLMKDQVNALTQCGIKAAYINATLTEKQYETAIKMIYEELLLN